MRDGCRTGGGGAESNCVGLVDHKIRIAREIRCWGERGMAGKKKETQ